MDFIEGRINVEPWQLPLLSGLLDAINQAGLTTFVRSLRGKIDPKALEVPWAHKAGCFEGPGGVGSPPRSEPSETEDGHEIHVDKNRCMLSGDRWAKRIE